MGGPRDVSIFVLRPSKPGGSWYARVGPQLSGDVGRHFADDPAGLRQVEDYVLAALGTIGDDRPAEQEGVKVLAFDDQELGWLERVLEHAWERTANNLEAEQMYAHLLGRVRGEPYSAPGAGPEDLGGW